MISTGKVNGFSRRLTADCNAASFFQYLAFSDKALSLDNNAFLDSYDSSRGYYGGSNVVSNGNIGTNISTIDLKNNVTVHGTQTTQAHFVLDPVIVPAGLTALVSSGELSFSNDQTQTLLSGQYKYSGISFGNKTKLVIAGNVTLYLTGDPSILSGNNTELVINAGASLIIYADGKVSFNNDVLVNNVSKIPGKFIIYSTYSGSDGVKIDNNSTFYGVIYAPQTDVILNNNVTLYGAIVGKTVEISNNVAVHFDEALKSFTGPGISSTGVLVHWAELR